MYKVVWHSKWSDDTVENQMSCDGDNVIVGRHGFDPFGKIVDNDNDVLMATKWHKIKIHEVDDPFVEWIDDDNWVQKRRRCPYHRENT